MIEGDSKICCKVCKTRTFLIDVQDKAGLVYVCPNCLRVWSYMKVQERVFATDDAGEKLEHKGYEIRSSGVERYRSHINREEDE